MQTFLPLPDDHASSLVLDDKRLHKQVVECSQILKAITIPSYGWQNHPAVRMWRPYPNRLLTYSAFMHVEYRRRRGAFMNIDWPLIGELDHTNPPWWGGPIHASHRANLLRKLPNHYQQYGWTECPTLPYFWPP